MDYASIKPEIDINNIDVNGDVDAQVELALSQAASALLKVNEQMEISVIDMLSERAGITDYRSRMDAIEKLTSEMRAQMNKVIPKLREHQESIATLAKGEPVYGAKLVE